MKKEFAYRRILMVNEGLKGVIVEQAFVIM